MEHNSKIRTQFIFLSFIRLVFSPLCHCKKKELVDLNRRACRTSPLCPWMRLLVGFVDLLHIFRTTVTHLTVFRLKILWSLLLLGKCLPISLRNVLAIFVCAFLLNGRLNQIIFRFLCFLILLLFSLMLYLPLYSNLFCTLIFVMHPHILALRSRIFHYPMNYENGMEE